MKRIMLIFVVGILLVSCSKQRSTDPTGKTFKQLCKDNGDIWMEMEPTLDGRMISQEKCFGCMIENNHFCTAEEYVNMITGI